MNTNRSAPADTTASGTAGLIERHVVALQNALSENAVALDQIVGWSEQLADLFDNGGKLLACGNGGSAAEAQHLTGELVGRFKGERRALPAIALHSDTAAATAILNDYGEDEYFARPVRAFGRPGDVLVAMSTSGTSRNVLAAVKAAQELNVRTWALTGPGPNPLSAMCDQAITVEAATTATIQEIHLVLVHALCTGLDNALAARS